MVLVGLVGESPHDTDSIANLLVRKYSDRIRCITLTPDIRGSQLDSPQPTKRILRRNFEKHTPLIVIFIRDLDGLENDASQMNLRKQYYTEMKAIVDKQSVFLLNIYALEALILADIDTLNKRYQTNLRFNGDPMLQVSPEKFLKDNTRSPHKYKESDAPEIFKELDFSKLLSVRYFNTFVTDFEKALYIIQPQS